MSQFARETAIERVGENHYRGELHAGWRVGAVPNGGYVMAIAGRALREVLPHKDPLTVNAFYLAPTALGPIDCHVEVLGSGPWEHQRMLSCGPYQIPTVALELRLATELMRDRPDRFELILAWMRENGCDQSLLRRALAARSIPAERQADMLTQVKRGD